LTAAERAFSILNVRSVDPAEPRGPAPVGDDDRTARARIRDAAIARFGADGVARTSLRSVAADAGVSPALVVHHFGSKDALRLACDRHVAQTIRDLKHAAMAAGPRLDLFSVLRDSEESRPLMRYLARVLVDSSPQVDALVDELVEDAVGYMEEGVRTGLLKPSRNPRGRAVLLTLWSLGALVLHEHAARLLGADLTGGPAGQAPYSIPATEVLGEGVLTPPTLAMVTQAFERLAAEREARSDSEEVIT
jgi:AcrR family transcriptional regulator